jgi:2-aminoadipate transaminase
MDDMLIHEKTQFVRQTRGVKRSALQDMLIEASHPDVLSFALGLPAAELFPTAAYAEALARVLSTDQRAMQYGPPFQPLKEHIAKLMTLRGVDCKAEQVFLTTGAQQGISLLAQLLLGPGKQVMVEEMTYTGFQQVIELYGPEILTVPTNIETGMDVDAVQSLLENGARPAFIYTVTDGHNPLAVSMSKIKRARLVELAKRYCIPIIEDDPYGFLYYQDRPIPPLRALDDQLVLYVGSFSKILAPALRVGWIIAPEYLIANLSNIKEASDIDTSTLHQRAISSYIDAGHLKTHLPMLRSEYRVRRDAMLCALDRHFPSTSRWHKPSSGVFIWVELPKAIDTGAVLKVALETERIAFIPGRVFCVNNSCQDSHGMRLNFSNSSVGSIEEGIARLARVLAAGIRNK